MSRPRLRFAPSPTGPLHIGGVRTALYNYVMAKKLGGDFLLRIEDTDQTRYVPGVEEYIQEALDWLGLPPDESPSVGGDYGPYRQSERRELYQKYSQSLLDSGHAYYAFDTPEELDAAREADPTFKYDAQARMRMRNSLTMDTDAVQQAISEGVPHVVRLKVEPGNEVTIKDTVRGEVTFQTEELDDKVLMKADGLPTYHHANIVDDYHMKITHVIRGEEWLSSTAHHVLLYRAHGWEEHMPQFAHLPLILKPAPESYLNKQSTPKLAARLAQELTKKHGDLPEKFLAKAEGSIAQILQDKKNLSANLKPKDKDHADKATLKAFLRDALFGKLSKRDGDRLGFPVFPLSWQGSSETDSFTGFREQGFLPVATLNFLGLLGWNPGTEQELFDLAELTEAFSMKRVNKSGTRFDYDKVKWFNQQYILNMDTAELAQLVRPTLQAHGQDPDEDELLHFVELMKERAVTLNDFWEGGHFCFQAPTSYEEKMVHKRWDSEQKPAFDQLADTLAELDDFSATNAESTVQQFMEDSGLKAGAVMTMLRLGLTGTMKGPGIYELMELIGQAESVQRLRTAFTTFSEMTASNG